MQTELAFIGSLHFYVYIYKFFLKKGREDNWGGG